MTTSHYRPPATGFERGMNTAMRWLTDRGANLAGTQSLTVTGRTSGREQRIVVNPLTLDGHEYLVSPRGNTQWVRNVRANPNAELRRGRRRRSVQLSEIPAAERGPMIRAYLATWGWEVGRFLPEGMTTDPDDAQLAEHADALPVFAVSPAAAR